MKKVLLTIIEKIKAVFIIDDFENIDGMSFDFLKEILSDDYFLERCKFIIISKVVKPGMGCITSSKLTENNYVDLTIAPFTKNQVEIFVKQYSELDVKDDFINLALKVSNGNPSIVEQMVLLYKDIRRNGLKHITYNSMESILDARLGILKQEDFSSYRMLIIRSADFPQ